MTHQCEHYCGQLWQKIGLLLLQYWSHWSKVSASYIFASERTKRNYAAEANAKKTFLLSVLTPYLFKGFIQRAGAYSTTHFTDAFYFCAVVVVVMDKLFYMTDVLLEIVHCTGECLKLGFDVFIFLADINFLFTMFLK